MNFNSDDMDRICKGLDAYLDQCLIDAQDTSLPTEDREYNKIEANEIKELIERICL